jgi:hypothetical protein
MMPWTRRRQELEEIKKDIVRINKVLESMGSEIDRIDVGVQLTDKNVGFLGDRLYELSITVEKKLGILR